ncbi:nucleocapsid protein [Lucheng Rn rat coronavirus]|uniref:Nucleoprotein n=1 Tax=Lucheng Rn rat coronavirus TaxID=1508224 RepID=A0A1L7HJ39_9ALPC|nr:nucleocapsid protein [Lucheng Rn rat coronavirus]APU57648.1 nucleocapsid protein [Lucheng Rn rat coronavirus]
MSSNVSWADQVETVNRRQRSRSRGRSQNRTNASNPLSWFTSIIDESNGNFISLMPHSGVPTGMGTAAQQCGYWYRAPTVYQVRRGKRVPLPPVWYFYFLGTGPHANAAYGTAMDGVFWVKTKNGQIDPKSTKALGVRDSGTDPRRANIPNLPEGLRVNVPNASRPQSRAQSQTRSQNTSRASSVSRNGSRAPSVDRTKEDLKAVVSQLLAEMGISKNSKQTQNQKKQKGSTPAATPHPNQDGKPVWKKKPNKEETVAQCFGPRSDNKNFGDAEFLRLGVDDPRFKTASYYAPGAAASLFDSMVTVSDGPDGKKRVTFHTTIEVDPTKPGFEVFLAQIDAFKKPATFQQTQNFWENQASTQNNISEYFRGTTPGAGGSAVEIETFEMTDETN